MGPKLRWQINTLLFILITLIIFSEGYFNLVILRTAMTTMTRSGVRTLAHNIMGWLQGQVLPWGERGQAGDIRGRRMLENYLQGFETLRSASVIDPGGRIVFSTISADQGLRCLHTGCKRALATGKPVESFWAYDSPEDRIGEPVEAPGLMERRLLTYEFFGPYYDQGNLVGILHLSMDLGAAPRLMRMLFIGNLILGALFLFTAVVAIALWTEKAVNQPLNFLRQAQDRLSKGDYDTAVPLELHSSNELVTLSDSFNRMARDLKQSRADLEEKTRKLESLNLQYRQLNERLELEVEEKTKELREFFSLITHDLKIPVAAIQGYADLLLTGKPGELSFKQRKFLHSISMGCHYLLSLVKNMLDTVKLEAGKITYFAEVFDLLELADEVAAQMRHLLEDKGVRINIEIPEFCRQVYADRVKTGQVMSNLVSNAINITPEGGMVAIKSRDLGLAVEVMISDTGPGIAPHHLEHVFDKFSQFPSESGASPGLGLGLYIVRKYVEDQGQSVRAESRLGQGSRFIFTLAKAGEEQLKATRDVKEENTDGK